MEEGSCEILQGTDSTWLAGAAVREDLSMLQGHLMGLDVALIAKNPWRRQSRGMVQMKPVFNPPLSFLTMNYFGIGSTRPGKHHQAKAAQSSSFPPGAEIDSTRGTLFYWQHYWKLGRVESPFSLFNPVCLSCFLPPEGTSFLPPQRFTFKPTRTSCVDLQGQMIPWDTLVLIKPNLSWQGRAAWTSIRFSPATPSSAVMSKLCNLGFDRLWGFSLWFLMSQLVPLTFQWPQYEH